MNESIPERANLMSVSINQLITQTKDGKHYCFMVPSYQRGYRWESEQIVRLLDDLYEFNRSSQNTEIYCLQPIIIKHISQDKMRERMGGNYNCTTDRIYYEVVDGQQRLTTIYLILKYIQRKEIAQFFGLEYERDTKNNFSRRKLLENLSENLQPVPKTVDEHYFIQAYEQINDWISKKRAHDSTVDNDMEAVIKKRTNVIWYELSDPATDCYQIFRNINNGKIPLTNAELVKAMLLTEKYFAPDMTGSNHNFAIRNAIIRSQQARFARLWDDIQHALSNEQMWSFITGNHDFETPTKIDFLLKLIVYKENRNTDNSGYSLFSFYENELNRKENMDEKRKYIEGVFEEIRVTFRTIQDWYEKPLYFNFIGMIMTYSEKSAKSSAAENRTVRIEKLASLIKCYNEMTRERFKLYLLKEIRDLINDVTPKNIGYTSTTISSTEQFQSEGNEKEDNVINYADNRKAIERWLMLFNILELNESGERFDFTVGRTGWSVEHIKAQSSEVAKKDDWKDYLSKERERIQAEKKLDNAEVCRGIITSIDAFISEYDTSVASGKNLGDEFETKLRELMLRIDKDIDGFYEEDEHRLGNLALLGIAENSMLNNSQFYEKRQKMLSKDGKHFPYATRRVFLKVYSEQTLNMDFSTWCKADFNSYLKIQHKKLEEFYTTLKNLEEQLNQKGDTQ